MRFLLLLIVIAQGEAVYSRTTVFRTWDRSIETIVSKALSPQRHRVLLKNEPIVERINGGDTQLFKTFVESGKYFRLEVQQLGIILSMTLLDAKGQQLVTMDNPSGGHGPISLSAIAATSGDYRLEVRSLEDWANPGSFKLSISELREARAEDQLRVEAERAFAEGSRANESNESKRAVDEYSRSLLYWQSIHDSHWEALTLYALGQAYRNSGSRKKAIDCFNESLGILAKQMDENDWRLMAAALNDLGRLYSLDTPNDKALSSLNQALGIFEVHSDRRGQGSSLNNLAILYARMGQLHTAREFAERALPLRQIENFRSGEINLLNTLGNIDDRLGDTYQARDRFTMALAAWKDLDKKKALSNRTGIASALNNLALANDKLGDWDAALNYYGEALREFAKTSQDRAAVLDNRGELFATLGAPDNAMQDYREALHVLDSLEKPDPDLKASILLHIGQVSVAKGDLTEAMTQFSLARQVKPNEPKLAYVLTNIGSVFALKNNQSKALEVYEEALKIQVGIEDRRGEAITRQKIGEVFASQGRESKARAEFNLALSHFRSLGDRLGEALTLSSMALMERDLNNILAALQLSEGVTILIELTRTRVSSHQLRTSYFATQENCYELNIALNMMVYRQTRNTEQLRSGLQSSEKSRARSLIDTLTEAHTDITEGVNQTLLLRERNLQQKIRLKSEAQTRLLSTKHNQQESKAISNELSALISESNQLRSQIRVSNPKYANLTQPQPIKVEDIQESLDSNSLLLEYSLGDKRSYVWAVTPDSVNGFELPSRQEIESLVQRLQKSIAEHNRVVKDESADQWRKRTTQADSDYAASSAALSKMVIGPVASLIGDKRLVIVADGALQLISFGALPVTDSAQIATTVSSKAAAPQSKSANSQRMLIEDHEIVYEPSASVLALQRKELESRKPASLAVAVLANPVFDQKDERVKAAIARTNSQRQLEKPTKDSNGSSERAVTLDKLRKDLNRAADDIGITRFQPLGSSAREAKAIVSVAPKGEAKLALDFDANRATATSKELANYRIVHFATHGLVDYENPELSGIVLSMVNEKGEPQDGYLRLHEIYNLNLPADLVVLSACQTGIGKQIKGEGLIALTRGFMYAGAQRVVASLWKVDDAATAELMAEFYKQMFVNQLKPAAALQKAQIKISRQPAHRSPYFWAGFVLQGEWK